MNSKKMTPYGSWKSPITADLVSKSSKRLSSIVLAGEETYWTELRPEERGRQVIVHRSYCGQTTDITPLCGSIGGTGSSSGGITPVK